MLAECLNFLSSRDFQVISTVIVMIQDTQSSTQHTPNSNHKNTVDPVCHLENNYNLLNNRNLMLTKTDLNQIGQVIDERLDSKLKQELEPIKKDLTDLKKDAKYLKKKVNRIDETVNLIVKNYDEADVKLQRRVRRIEHHLALPEEN
jgi:hypothetical protein